VADSTDWLAWHADYDDPESALSRRLRVVQGRVSEGLDDHDGEVRVVSACAGDGRDVIEVLARRPDAGRVSAVLIEWDERNADAARVAARDAGLDNVEVRCADAGHLDAYEGAAPADLLLFCGVFGNVSDEEVERAVAMLPRLLEPGATVIWTRSRREPDLTPAIRGWFAGSGFVERHFYAPEDVLFSVGVHQLATEGSAPAPRAGRRLFRFVD
jgi:SAM-dependent methyltransferase